MYEADIIVVARLFKLVLIALPGSTDDEDMPLMPMSLMDENIWANESSFIQRTVSPFFMTTLSGRKTFLAVAVGLGSRTSCTPFTAVDLTGDESFELNMVFSPL